MASLGSNLFGAGTLCSALTNLIDRLDSDEVRGSGVIPWSSPVPSFGDVLRYRIATLGINPSNREFVDEFGNELQGPSRRFHTLDSLGLKSWAEVDVRHLESILGTCQSYFWGNPYNLWFRKLDSILAGVRASYYDAAEGACHLDLVPYATMRKWTQLTAQQRTSLLAVSGDTLALLLRDSPVRILILNGNSVVRGFESIAGVRLEVEEVPSWSLERSSGCYVAGLAYRGIVDNLAGLGLGHEVLVLGFNHNIQGSFGVSRAVIGQIRDWIARVAGDSQW